jgi:3-oxoacyl-[acyl-carrier protein] reductase
VARTAVVTGASRGLGVAFARVLAEEGCDLALGARDVAETQQVADELAVAHGVRTWAHHLDVTDPASLTAFRAAALERFDHLDVLVANAGIGRFAPIVDASLDDVAAMFDVNVTGFLATLRTFAHDLEVAPTRGLVVSVTSDVSARVFAGGAGYVASKHAARAISRTFQLEHPDLRVCELRPGSTVTAFGDRDPGRDRRDGQLTAAEVAEVLRVAITAPADVRVEELVVRHAGQAYEL